MAFLILVGLIIVIVSAQILCENPCYSEESQLFCCAQEGLECGNICCPIEKSGCLEIDNDFFEKTEESLIKGISLTKECNKSFLLAETELRILFDYLLTESWDVVKAQLILVLKYLPYFRAYCFGSL